MTHQPRSPRDEILLILQGVADEIVRIASGNLVKPKSSRKPAKRYIGMQFVDEHGRLMRVVGRDDVTPDGYIIRRSDGRYFTLYKKTIDKYLGR
jgi:hypothetical protein